jgi:hypothetical protein
MSISTVRQLLGLWETPVQIAADLGVNYKEVALWQRDGRVPEPYQAGLVASARRRNIPGVTLALIRGLPTAEGVGDFTGVIALWPSASALAADLNLPPSTIRAWKSRNHIPPDVWRGMVQSASNHGIRGLTYVILTGLASRNGKTRGKPDVRDGHLAQCLQ